MLRRVVHSGANLFAFMLCIVVLCCELPSQQVSAITTIYEIIQNYSTPHSHFLWNNFSKNSNPCSWKGVGCSPDHSSIISITFSSSGISTSEFLPLVCNITTLESLDVSNNYLRSIPDGFFTDCGNVSGLKHLDFSGNRLYGPLPSFNGLKMLLHLDFSRNLLSGEISRELDGLASLKILELSDNGFAGRIPTNIGKMSFLEVLALDRNSFTGSIPQELAELTKLQTLMLSFNHLSGPIPAGVSNITTLLGIRGARRDTCSRLLQSERSSSSSAAAQQQQRHSNSAAMVTTQQLPQVAGSDSSYASAPASQHGS